MCAFRLVSFKVSYFLPTIRSEYFKYETDVKLVVSLFEKIQLELMIGQYVAHFCNGNEVYY